MQISYDNKYKPDTSFATDDGRVKRELNVNRGDEAALKGAEKTAMMDELRHSNINDPQILLTYVARCGLLDPGVVRP